MNNTERLQFETAVAQANRLRDQRDKLRAVCRRALETGALKDNPLLEIVTQRYVDEAKPSIEDWPDIPPITPLVVIDEKN